MNVDTSEQEGPEIPLEIACGMLMHILPINDTELVLLYENGLMVWFDVQERRKIRQVTAIQGQLRTSRVMTFNIPTLS